MPKKPFSGKQKKEQLRAKRERIAGRVSRADQPDDVIKLDVERNDEDVENDGAVGESESRTCVDDSLEPDIVSRKDKKADPNRYKLQFFKESKEELKERQRLARLPIRSLGVRALKIDFPPPTKLDDVLEMPKRPPWDYGMSREQLERQELQFFRSYVENIKKDYRQSTHQRDLSYFELNLETWRQLWRVLEISDVILCVVDVRFPPVHFPPSLYRHVTEDLKKRMIVVVNKVDLAPASLVAAWVRRFRQRFPAIQVVCFSSCPMTDEELEAKEANEFAPGKNMLKKRMKRAISDAGPRQLVEVCQNIVDGKVDLTSWRHKIDEDERDDEDDKEVEEDDDDDDEPATDAEEVDASFDKYSPFKGGSLTIGCCGIPNVGKSSVMNALIGKKVVSVSKTPGHTKHFQTYYLTDNVILCDCPGLVFPSQIDRPLQILAGMYPVAQVQEPYTVVGYLAQRLNLPKILRIEHPDGDGGGVWTAMDICDAWAEKRGFMTARGSRPDSYRAANELLRLSVEGKLVFCLQPLGYDDDVDDDDDDDGEENEDDDDLNDVVNMVRNIQTAKKRRMENSSDVSRPNDSKNDDSRVTAIGNEDEEKGSEDEEPQTLSKNAFALLGDEDD